MVKKKGSAYINLKVVRFMKEIGKMGIRMGKDVLYYLMVADQKENGHKVKKQNEKLFFSISYFYFFESFKSLSMT